MRFIAKTTVLATLLYIAGGAHPIELLVVVPLAFGISFIDEIRVVSTKTKVTVTPQ